jgi:hypothetical protein
MPPETPAGDPRAWAARLLGVQPDVTPDEVRALFRRRLAEEDFLSPPTWQQAVAVLTGAEAPAAVRLAAAFEEEERLREEVEAFAVRFFGYAPEERERRWQELADRGGFAPALAARLEQLKPGLAIDPVTGGNGDRADQLAGHVLELFVLRPSERAFRRRVLSQELRQDLTGCRKAVRQLRERYPSLAALQKEWLDELQGGECLQRRAAWVRRWRRRGAAVWAALLYVNDSPFAWWLILVLFGSGVSLVTSRQHNPTKVPSRTHSRSPADAAREGGEPARQEELDRLLEKLRKQREQKPDRAPASARPESGKEPG